MLAGEQGLQVSPHVSREDAGALGGGMLSIRLVQLGDSGDSLEKGGHESHVVLFGELGEDGDELPDVGVFHVRRRREPGKEHGDAPRSSGLDDRCQVLLHLRGREASKPVVGPEREDEGGHVAVLEHPVEATSSASARIAGDSRVHHLVRILLFVEEILKGRRISLVETDPEPGGQAVAERDDLPMGRPARDILRLRRDRARLGRRRAPAFAGRQRG